MSDENPAETFASDAPKNWAEDSRIRERLRSELFPLMQDMRSRKAQLNAMWGSLFKVWSLEHERQSYVGTSNLYVPAGKKGVETLTSQLVAATFPGDDVFAVEPRELDYKNLIPEVKAAQQHYIEYARVRAEAEKFYRLLAITGNAPVKFTWHTKKLSRMGLRKSNPKEAEMFGLATPSMGEKILYDGPRFDVVDPANLYIYPETVERPQDAIVVFEDITVPLSNLRAKAGKVYVQSEVENAAKGEISEKSLADDNRLTAQGFGAETRRGNEPYGAVDISEVYLDFDPRAADYASEKNPVPFLVTVTASGQILRAVENPWWHKQVPYALGRMGTQAGRIWGTGFVEAIRELQLLLNDQTNQMMDCASYHLNPIVLVNPNLVHGGLPDLEPGVQLMVQDMAAIKFDRPPGDLIQSGSVLSSQTQAWINDFIGAPPVLQGGSAPGRAFKTATGIGTAQRNAVVPLQEVVKLCEVEVWEPMLEVFWSLAQQHARSDIMLRIAGEQRQVNPGNIYGDYMFRWLASSQAQSQQVKGSQITQLLQILGAPPMTALAQANGFRINPKPLLRRLYQEVFGFRDVDEVLVEGTAQAAGMAPTQPNVGAPPSLNGNEETSPSPEFEDTRMEANDLAALMGGMNGGANFPGEE